MKALVLWLEVEVHVSKILITVRPGCINLLSALGSFIIFVINVGIVVVQREVSDNRRPCPT